MKLVYPVVIEKNPKDKYHLVTVPDFDRMTQGKNMYDAVRMARDLIGLMTLEYEDEKQKLPQPSALEDIKYDPDKELVTLVDIDTVKYRRDDEVRTVRRNVTLPGWLDGEARKAKINVSAVLQRALKEALDVKDK